MTANSYIGSAIERFEDLRFLRGRGQYVDDLTCDGVLHAAILRSSIAHGTIQRIDPHKALENSGVHAVITAADIGASIPVIPMRTLHFKTPGNVPLFFQPVIAQSKVRYVGEPLAVVIADTAALAEDALDNIAVDITPLPVCMDHRAAARGDILLFESTGTNLACVNVAAKGDADAAFSRAPYKRREAFSVQRHTGVPMELRGLLATWDAAKSKMTVCGAAKLPFFTRAVLAKTMGLPVEAIEMVENDVGGGFGIRGEFYPEDFLIPFAARKIGRPVKWVEDRREHLLATNHSREIECEIEIACTRDGKVLGIRGEMYVNTGAYLRPSGLGPPFNVVQFVSGAYDIPNIRLEAKTYVTNKGPAGTYRAPGRFESNFFCERLMDMAARDLGIDRVEMRRRNLIRADQMPYPLAQHEGRTADATGECCDSGDYRSTFDRCLKEFNWTEKATCEGQLIEGRYHGLGLAPYIEGGAGGFKERARMVLESDGTVSVYVGSSALGQGIETVFRQIAADALEMPISAIRGLHHGSTSHVSEGFGSWHSRATVMGGSALVVVAKDFKAAIRAAAALRFGCDESDVTIAEGKVLAEGKSLPLGELASAGISVESLFENHKHTYTYGTAAAHVAIDPKTGHLEVLDYLVVEDVGRIINPRTLHGQVLGSIMQGLGGALLEHLIYDDNGQLLTGSLADYLMPTASDFPRVRAVELEEWPSPVNPLGVKGAGEGGVIAVGAVIANAVASALSSLNVQPLQLPLTPQRVWELIQAAR